MSIIVSMQLNVGANEAGDWANRPRGDAANATSQSRGDVQPGIAADDYLLVRIHQLRGAVDAMCSEPTSESIHETRTARPDYGYGSPVAYQGLRFVTRACF